MYVLALWRRLRTLVGHRRWTRELDEEIRLHLDLRTAANRAAGMTPDAAERAARAQFGNTAALRERARDVWAVRWFEALGEDARYACRRVVGDRGLTVAVVLTLAIGIGGNTAMFTLIDRVLFRPPPGQAPEELVWIATTERPSQRLRSSSYPDYLAVRDAKPGMRGVAAFTRVPLSLGGGMPERLDGALVTANYFDVLGHPPALGRAFHAGDDAVVVLSDALWRRRFGGATAILGAPLVINGHPMTVIGVAPPGFRGLEIEPADVFLPIAAVAVAMPGQPELLTSSDAAWLQMFGRMEANGALKRVQAGLDVVAYARAQTSTDADALRGFSVQPLRGAVDPQNRTDAVPVFGLLTIVPLLVLGVACANAGNLLLARGLGRNQELAIRRALGASRGRVVRQMLTESTLLSLAGGVVGVALAYALLLLVLRLAELPAEVAASFRPDVRGVMMSLVLSVAAVFAFGLAPALALTGRTHASSNQLMQAASRSDVARRLRGAFVIAQVAASCLLVVLAGVLHRSVTTTLQADPGFNIHDAMALSYDLPLQGYDVGRRAAFDGELLREVRRLPQVESAALVSSVALGGRFVGTSLLWDGAPGAETGLSVGMATISAGYLTTMKIPLRRGRDLAEVDADGAPLVAIVNENLAARLWPDGEAVGRRLRLDGDDRWREVVGVAADGKYDDFHESPRPFVYLPQAQYSLPWQTLVVRARADSGELTAAIREIVRRLDDNVPLYDVMTLEQVVGNAVDRSRGIAWLLILFGSIALTLAALGLHAVTVHAVMLGRREIGIRMSLGARPSQVAVGFLRQGLQLAGLGLGVGGALGAAIAMLLASEVAGLRTADMAPYVGSAVLVIVVTSVASGLPAIRAARTDPWKAIRSE